ncbi:MAG: VWA domain-containing protein [Thermomicrobiales bacterium]|nr:VWA domain-containing protein [Thermomicrobiales bacterium]
MSHTPSSDSASKLKITTHWLKPLLPAGGGDTTLLIRLVAAPDPNARLAAPMDVAFVLDRSGSMGGGKLALAKEGVALALERLRPTDRVALVIYDDDVEVMQPLAEATPELITRLARTLRPLDSGGSTFLSGGWVAGCQQLAHAPAEGAGRTRIRRVILLTDGLANVGILDPQELAKHVSQLRKRGIMTSTVGVGLDFDEGLLSIMAEAGGGNFVYAETPLELRAFFARELQEMLRVASTTTTLHVTLPRGVHGRLISAFPVEREGKTFKVAVGDVPAGDVIDLVMTLDGQPGALGDILPLRASCHWTDPATDLRRRWDISPTPLERVSAEEVAATPADAFVQERAALQHAAAERRAGLELDRAGRLAESRAAMRRSRELLAAAPPTADVREHAAESDYLADLSRDAPIDSHTRKAAQMREHLRRYGRPTEPHHPSTDQP